MGVHLNHLFIKPKVTFGNLEEKLWASRQARVLSGRNLLTNAALKELSCLIHVFVIGIGFQTGHNKL